MFFSKKLIAQFLPEINNITDQEMIDACGTIGLEIEHVHYHPKLNNLVIGKLLEFKKHPDADTLNICQVLVNREGKINTIITGAPGLIAGKNVIVALAGAKLHDGRVIEEKPLRGIKSEGMLCAYYELTPLNDGYVAKTDEEGILQFDDGFVGDTAVAEFLGLDDVIYEISIPFANRNDLNGVLAFCQELAGHFGWPFVYPKIQHIKTRHACEFPVTFDHHLANGVSLMRINNVKYRESNWSLKGLLINNHLRPLNNLLDILNYVTLLTNVATAAYDANKMHGGFHIAFAKKDDHFTAFNGVNYTLAPTDGVIKNGNGNIICLAGIIGDKEFGYQRETRDLIIELGNFNFPVIRKTATKFNLATDAAKRFSKPVSPFSTVLAAEFVVKMLGKKNIVWLGHFYAKLAQVILKNVNFNLINHFLGMKITPRQIKHILRAYGFKFKGNDVLPPIYRLEVTSSQDLAEEILKALDINHLPPQPIDYSHDQIDINQTNEYYFFKKLRDFLTNHYFNEVKTYNTINERELHPFNVFNYQNNIKIVSSNNINRQYLRTNTINSLLKVYQYNLARKNDLLPIFELQKVYQTSVDGELNLTLIAPATYFIDRANQSKISFNVNGLKGLAVTILSELFNAQDLTFSIDQTQKIFYNDEALKIIYHGQTIGYLGAIRDHLLKPFDLTEPVYCLTLNLNRLIADYRTNDVVYQPISSLPQVIKDITFDYKVGQHLGETIAKIQALPYIQNVTVVNHYVNSERNTYTIRVTFNNTQQLKKEQINNYILDLTKMINGGN